MWSTLAAESVLLEQCWRQWYNVNTHKVGLLKALASVPTEIPPSSPRLTALRIGGRKEKENDRIIMAYGTRPGLYTYRQRGETLSVSSSSFICLCVSGSVSDCLALILDSVFPVLPFLMYGAVREFLECLAFSLFKIFLFPQTKKRLLIAYIIFTDRFITEITLWAMQSSDGSELQCDFRHCICFSISCLNTSFIRK